MMAMLLSSSELWSQRCVVDSHSWWWVALLSLILYRAFLATASFVLSDQQWQQLRGHCFLKEQLANQICPKRRARFWRCWKRCESRRKKTCRQQQEGSSCDDNDCPDKDQCEKICEIGKALITLHLPPPLPFFKKKKTKSTSCSCPNGTSCSRCEGQSSGSTTSIASSSTPTHTADTPKRAGVVASFAPAVLSRSTSTSLIDMVRMQQWTAVLENVSRRGAKHRDQDGLYPLHWACCGSPPVAVIDALLEAYPSAAHKVDLEGSTPLHFATHYSAPFVVIEAILKAYPKAINIQDKYGRTPLYHATEKSLSIEVLKLLVEANPTCILCPCLAKDKRNQPITRDSAVRTPLYVAWASALRDRQTRLKAKGKKWDKAEYLLATATTMTAGRQAITSLVEQVVHMDLYLPEQLTSLVLESRPEQAGGSQALFAAVSVRHYSQQRSLHLTKLCLKYTTEAAATSLNAEGRSVLACAAMANQPWETLETLFQLAPQTLLWRDPITGLPPVLQAAASSKQPPPCSNSSRSHRIGNLDPYHLLSSKQRQLLAGAESFHDERKEEGPGPETMHVNTIYNLLHHDPSVIQQQSSSPRASPLRRNALAA